VPPALSNLILRLLEKNPSGRPASAQIVADELAAIQRGMDTAADRRPYGQRPQSPETLMVPTRKSRRAYVLLAAAMLLLFVGGWFFGPTLIRLITNQGVLVVEVDD